jgi:hypothetical protein
LGDNTLVTQSFFPRVVTRDPYNLTFSAGRDGIAYLSIGVRNVHNDPAEPFLDYRGHVGLLVRPNCKSTYCLITTDSTDDDTRYRGQVEKNFAAETRQRAIDIARVAWTTLDEFPGRSAHGVIRFSEDTLDYGYYRERIPANDPEPWRRCRFSSESVRQYQAWRDVTGYGPTEIDFICSSLDLATNPIRGIGPEGVSVEFLDEGPFQLTTLEGQFPLMRVNEVQDMSPGRRA